MGFWFGLGWESLTIFILFLGIFILKESCCIFLTRNEKKRWNNFSSWFFQRRTIIQSHRHRIFFWENARRTFICFCFFLSNEEI